MNEFFKREKKILNSREKFYEEVYNAANTKVIRPTREDGSFLPIKNSKNTIFLAGPCPREKSEYKNDWRYDAVDILNSLGFTGSVFSPTNEHYAEAEKENGLFTLEKQTKWEYEAMHKASAIVFYVERTRAHPSFTTNIEIGQWLGKRGVYVGWSKDAWKNEYLGIRCKMAGQHIYDNLEDMLKDVVKDLSRPSRNFFTSDTHFGMKRTLDLSRRPFCTVNDMDLEMISNWNKSIRMRDTVYHLGDFGSLSVLDCLNFGEMKLVLGNYERNELEDVQIKLNSYPNVHYFNNDELTFTTSSGKILTLRHEPLLNERRDTSKLYLYGHIHGRMIYKRNGIDMGIDSSHFTPLSQEEMEWRLDAALKYVDENVFTEYCK